MPTALLQTLCTWSDVQALLIRCSDNDLTFKVQLAKQMLSVAILLYRWHRSRTNGFKALGLTFSHEYLNANFAAVQVQHNSDLKMTDSSGRLVDENDLMEATDAGGEEYSDNDNDMNDDGDNGQMDQDTGTENEMGGNEHDAGNDAFDSDEEGAEFGVGN